MWSTALIIFPFSLLLLFSGFATVAGFACDCKGHPVSCNVFGHGAVAFGALESKISTGNIVFCPLGLWVILIYAYMAAQGDTKTALYNAIFTSSLKNTCNLDTQTYTYYKDTTGKYMKFVERDAPFFVRSVTLYSPKHHKDPKQNYADSVIQIPAATVTSADFAKYGVGAIRDYENSLYKNKARFMKNGDVTKDTEFVIHSMLKFNARWKIPFTNVKESKYKKRHFSMMSVHGDFVSDYDRSGETSYLFLEFEIQGLLMVIVLSDSKEQPTPNWNLFDLENKKTKYQKVAIPKFDFEVEYSLKDVINALGGGILFTGACDIPEIHGTTAQISQVIQRTLITVHKDGVKFEAYTALVGDKTAKPRNLVNEHAEYNKPFTFYLFAYETLIAQGRVMDPSY